VSPNAARTHRKTPPSSGQADASSAAASDKGTMNKMVPSRYQNSDAQPYSAMVG